MEYDLCADVYWYQGCLFGELSMHCTISHLVNNGGQDFVLIAHCSMDFMLSKEGEYYAISLISKNLGYA